MKRESVHFRKLKNEQELIFFRKFDVPAAKRVCCALLEIAASNAVHILICRKTLKTASESVGRQNLQKHLVSSIMQRLTISVKFYQTSQSVAKRFFHKHS